MTELLPFKTYPFTLDQSYHPQRYVIRPSEYSAE